MKKQLITICLVLFLFGCEKSNNSDAAAFSSPGIGGSLARFTIAGNYLYTVDNENLKVYNIANPALPQFKSSVHVGFQIETIFPFKDKLFIGSTSVVYIFSLANPEKPEKLAIASSAGVYRRCDPVVAKDSVAYATLRTNGPCGGTESVLAVYDITDVTNPKEKTALPVTEPYGLGYEDNALYVCDKYRGLLMFDISQPYNPALVKTVTTNFGTFVDVIPYNNVLICWTTVGMILYDISNRFNPVLIKGIN